jgi:hypothetical protein
LQRIVVPQFHTSDIMKHSSHRNAPAGRASLFADLGVAKVTGSVIGGLIVGLAVAGCSSGGGGGGGSGQAVGTVATNPNTGLSYIVEPHAGGGASALKLKGAFWGRLVDILDEDRDVIFRDFVIGEDIKSNGSDFELERNPVTERELLIIKADFGTVKFTALFNKVETNVQAILDRGLGPNVLPPYSKVARNAAVVLRFDDLVSNATVNKDTIKVLTGYPPATPYELRILPDPNHGDLVGGTFRSTRVILDLTVSKFEALVLGQQVNSLGLPEAITTAQPNFAIRIPTILNPPAGQFELLTNLNGSEVSFNGNGSNDPFSPTLDIVRAARSGGPFEITGDLNNGFLVDEFEPEILGAQAVNVFLESGPGGINNDEFLVRVDFATILCASRPRRFDVIELPNHTLEVTQPGATPIGGSVTGLDVRVIVGDPVTLFNVAGQYRTVWDPTTGALPECFVRFSPPAGTPPNLDVRVDADVIFSFSEPMDPASITAFDTYELTYDTNPNGINPLYERVVGEVRPSTSLIDYHFEPSLPLRNKVPGESYSFTVKDGPTGVTDLAGNGLSVTLPPIQFFIDPAAPTIDSGSVSLTFSSTDEDNNGFPEIRGQFLYDLTAGLVKPRAPQRFSAAADPTQPVVGSMVPIQVPIQTPLSNLGSKMMGVWRYHDVGFTLLDDTNHNLDVEGLWWEPFSSTLQIDNFPQFQMRLGHSRYLPDEDITTGLLPTSPSSGLVVNYDSNWLHGHNNGGPINDPPVIAHPKPFGYQLSPLDVVQSGNNRAIAPWPMNRMLPQSQFVYWTWRDTSILGRAAPKGGGVDTKRYLGTGGAGFSNFWTAGDVPTIGLPMLMEFRTYNDASSVGQNGFKIAIAINSSARPYFRTFSTGGILNSGTAVIINPDTEASGGGGVNPNNGNSTPPQDNAFYYGQADFVVRINRIHTMWLDSLGTGSDFVTPSIEPAFSELPTGTAISMAYRGASKITSAVNRSWENAMNLSPYGDSYTTIQHNKLTGQDMNAFTVTWFPTSGNDDWTTDINGLDGARYVQARITLISNPETQLTPVFSALGLSYIK